MDREFRNEQIGRVNQQGDEAHGPARRPRSRVHARGDRDHHARRAGAAARAARQGPPRRGRRRRHHDLRRPRGSRGDVRRAALRHQGRARRSSRTASCARRRPGRLLRVGAEYDPSIEPTLEELFEDRYSVQFSSYPVREPWLLEPARTVAAQRDRDEAARRRDRGHLRRGVPDVGRARGDHRGDAGLGAGGRALDDRLRHLGDRLQVRGEHRARARPRRDARRAARRQRAAVRDGPGGRRQAARRARRADRADLPDDGVLQRPGRARTRSTSAGSCATSATATRPARCSTGGATGACR